MKVFGLIGYPLSHSFSADYFNAKFRLLGLHDYEYKLFPLESISDMDKLLHTQPGLAGLNVTIPYKVQVLPYVQYLFDEARLTGSVNCISINNGRLAGYNTDCYGFEHAYLDQIISASSPVLILGNGGASRAVQYVLKNNNIRFLVASRSKSDSTITYDEITASFFNMYKVIINTTPLGMYPDIAGYPPIKYQHLTEAHLLIDLIYNPEKTAFLLKGESKGCQILNGLQMLHYQADKSWEIWLSQP